jgi:hypothetical protein
MKLFIHGFFLLLIFLLPLRAQDAAPAAVGALSQQTPAIRSTGNTTIPASVAPAGQAPDEVMAKLSDLYRTGKIAEAQQLAAGLLLAYPDDQKLAKVKSLLDKLLAAQSVDTASNVTPPANVVASDSQLANSVAPVQPKVENTNDGFVGTGMQVAADPESHAIKITGIFPNSPASEAGLSSGLIIEKVDGVSTEGKTLGEALNLLHGAIGTKVQLELINPDTKAATAVELTRQKIQLANDTNPAQLTGMDRVEYDSLKELGSEAQQATDLDQQKALLKQFIIKSTPFLQIHPHETLLMEFYAAAAITLDYPMYGYWAGQRLLANGAADSNDPNLQRLLGQLKNKGWLDRQTAQAAAKQAQYDWLLGTWGVSYSINWHPRGVWPANLPALVQSGNLDNEEFSIDGSSGSPIGGFSIYNGNKGYHLAGNFLNSGEIHWAYYLDPAGSFVGYHTAYWGRKTGQVYYPNGWQPIISCEISADKTTMTMVIPSQDTDPNSKNPMSDTVTLHFTKIDDTQSQ